MFESSHFIICWIGYTIIVLFAWIVIYKKFSKGRGLKTNYMISFLICTIFGLFAVITPDYYAYYGFIEKVRIWILPKDVETLYALLIPYLNYDYLLFRAIIIIPAFCLLFYIFKQYAVDMNLCVSLFVVFNLLSFATTIRSSLADGIFYVGAFLYIRNNSYKHFIICLGTTVLCCFFHKSAFMLIVPFVASLCHIGKNIKFLIAIFPVAVILGKIIVSYVFSKYLEESIYGSYQSYLSGSIMLRDYLQNFVFFMLILYTLWYSRDLLKSKTRFYAILYRLVFFSGYIWGISLCIGVSRYLPSRFLTHMMIPVLLLITYTCQYHKRKYLTAITILGVAMIVVSEFGTLTTYREGVL